MISQSTCDYWNRRNRELREDPRALDKQFHADMQRGWFAPTPVTPQPMDDTGAEEIQS